MGRDVDAQWKTSGALGVYNPITIFLSIRNEHMKSRTFYTKPYDIFHHGWQDTHVLMNGSSAKLY